ncbi:uncharacterized protein BDW47DRAFT_126774 [Aspergillus candidus]|uniref:Uncharacterized protein n=1 Tax=Aspergillus candidus TaxID=41067 RepID=A0A2I2F8B5_ASPCN|nr:hypothetical protein BDW47DRAFT_126774 [Aspergillus candidus]PLB36859.1 hypothetical protein BDW47DRAFT_126774 [Aspergillus candidus]
MSAPIMQSFRSMGSSVGEYSRQQLNVFRNRVLNTETRRQRANVVRTSMTAHRPVWISGVGGVYTSMAAVYLTLKFMSRLK